MDPAGNRKIDKDKVRFRIDGAVALAMLMGLRARDRGSEAADRYHHADRLKDWGG